MIVNWVRGKIYEYETYKGTSTRTRSQVRKHNFKEVSLGYT